VKLIDGANIYVTDGQGNVVKVTTSHSSRFTHTGQGSIADDRLRWPTPGPQLPADP
jgi:hypothetical protein